MEEMLNIIAARDLRREGVYGIRRAYDYVSPFVGCVGDEACRKAFFPGLADLLSTAKLGEMLKASEQTLVYSNEDTVPVHEKLFTSSGTMMDFCKSIEIDMPAKTIMVFANVVTTPKKDRDGDRLMTEGAIVDKQMPLLWHHMLPMPIGKMLKVLEHTADRLVVATALIDSPMGNDAALLTEFGALRISHGFRPLEFELLNEGKSDSGFKVTKFEIMEESEVSVPSNTDAVITAFARGKLHDPTVKQWAKTYHDTRPVRVPGMSLPVKTEGCKCHEKEKLVEFIKTADAETLAALKEALGVKENPNAPYGHCVTCGSVLKEDGTCTNANCGQIQSATPPANKAGRVLSSANMKKLEQAKEILAEVLAAATVKTEDDDAGDTEDEELSPLRQPEDTTFAGVVQFLEKTLDRSTLAAVKSIVERRDAKLEDAELLEAIGAAR